eukprot:TRINITY_DN15058_c0_g2_i1.p1 TRINITY_DN15058_c0_g2~~TRINITY_DN15058_c0_g2_i1.p1  ORF type:complete len:112 (+),score=2.94 TRINITY_DN15058_c0_g2_i1:333-668(+)
MTTKTWERPNMERPTKTWNDQTCMCIIHTICLPEVPRQWKSHLIKSHTVFVCLLSIEWNSSSGCGLCISKYMTTEVLIPSNTSPLGMLSSRLATKKTIIPNVTYVVVLWLK